MFCLACTGGIGSGKSYVVKIFSALGFPVYIADEQTKILYNEDRDLLNSLVELLGPEIIIEGMLQKRVMAQKIFSDEVLLSKVNEVVHPFVLKDFQKWSIQKEKEGHELVIIESAIYLESKVFKGVANKVLVVEAPEHIRIERVKKRDSATEEMVRTRINRQMSVAQMRSMSDYTIFADGKRAVLPQVLKLLEILDIKINNIQ
jgi:dephospho-CoA kinase